MFWCTISCNYSKTGHETKTQYSYIILEVYSIKDAYYYHKSVLVLHTIKPMNCYSVFVMLACLWYRALLANVCQLGTK